MFKLERFFTPAEQNKVIYFLQRFPSIEVWRFFVERIRYDNRKMVANLLIKNLENIKINFLGQNRILNTYELVEYIETCSLKELHRLALSSFSALPLLNTIINFFKFSEEDERSFKEFVEAQRAWVGFEETEPGYLCAMAKGFAFILGKLQGPDSLSTEFIKTLHSICTTNVKNVMLFDKPGEFRKILPARWALDSIQNTFNGTYEILQYMQSSECKGLSFISEDGSIIASTMNKEFDAKEKARLIWAQLQGGSTVLISTCEQHESISDVRGYLHEICNFHLINYNKESSEANLKLEKLTSIFKFIKHIVLHHPFSDGVGRTCSMLLTQYLLMKNNLLPVILENSNFIPGWSVEEMVTHYLSLEKEMEEILRNPTYLSSEFFSREIVTTVSYLEELPETKKAQFMTSVKIIEDAIESYLNPSEKLISNFTI